MVKKFGVIVLCVALVSCASMDTFLTQMNADLATLDFVYNTAESWYAITIAGTPKENECVSAANNTCGNPGSVGTQTVKQLHDKIKADYTAGTAAIKTLIAAYSAAKQQDILNTFKLISSLVVQIVSLIALLGGPSLTGEVPARSYQAVARLPVLIK